MWYDYIIEIVLGYIFGSVSASVLLTKFAFKKDVRDAGSGNAGATNVARVFGMKAGLITLGCDVLKIVIPMLVGMLLDGDRGVCIAGIAGIAGHCFPVFFKFRGGKGVSVAATIAIFLGWQVIAISLGVFIIVVLLTRIVSISSIAAGITLVSTTVIFYGDNTYKVILAAVSVALVIFMHRENIKRLVKGEEKKFTPKK